MSDNLIREMHLFASKKMEELIDDEGLPAYNHPIQVASIISLVNPGDINLVCAALAHDLIEDCDVTHKELLLRFNQDIADLVNEVTHEGSKEKGYYFPRLKTQRGIVLKFADRLHNLSRMDAWNEKRRKQYLDRSRFWKLSIEDIINLNQQNETK